ncbi:hypothetical protein ACFC26_09555 [Kitasatospora purpeofusca]|uniref:hypothetical protein n=1 Tax=Kitasatospora purpeofusca TaxID=67352 RepID=UPI0035D77911
MSQPQPAPLDLDAIQETLPQAAGYGPPWHVTRVGSEWLVNFDPTDPEGNAVAAVEDYRLARFFASSITDVPDLLDRVRQLEAELVDVQKAQTGDRVHPRHWDLFAENAAPDAIRAHLDVARADQRNAARYTTRLESLLATREQQPAT